MKAILSSFASLCLLFTVACGPTVDTYRPTQADLSNYQSFAFLPNANISMPDNSKMSSDEVSQMVVQTINNSMRQQGYQLDRENPDLLILASVKTSIETDVDYDPIYANYPYTNLTATTIYPAYDPYYYPQYTGYTDFVGYDTDINRYKEGSLVIDVVDRSTRQVVWKGISSKPIYSGSTSEAIADLVMEIFEEYPATDATASL